MKIHIVTVSGSTNFPIDMLRNDHLYPENQNDTTQILRSLEPDLECAKRLRYVTLNGIHDVQWKPSYTRWQSFGWEVTRHLVKKHRG